MERNIIFYFTGTGNSLKVAKDIAAKLESCEVVSMAKPVTLSAEYERIGFVFPCYAQGLPLAAVKFIESLDLSKNPGAYYFTVPTCGANPGNCIAQVHELLVAKNLSLSYGKIIKMFANCITLYKMADNPKERAARSNKETEMISRQIVEKSKTAIPKTNVLLRLVYKKMAGAYPSKAANYRVSDACIGCGKCKAICPAGNIEMRNGKPLFGAHCEQCMACIQWCPNHAIDDKSKTQKSTRYHHPEISFEEIEKGNTEI
jgi:ferredoxin